MDSGPNINHIEQSKQATGQKVSTEENSENSLDEDFIYIGSPIAIMWFDFLMYPQSSIYAKSWSLMLCSIVVLRIIGIGFESCDGPNQYYHRSVDHAQYPWLLTEPQYFQLYVACMTPLLLDAFLRLVIIFLIFLEPENQPIYQRFISDKTEIVLFFVDVFCMIPFLVNVSYVHPNDMTLSQAPEITLRIMELGITGRVFRLVRYIPAIRAVSIALTNSFEHLVLPLFFFFAFNITTGVFFYFAEPCYNMDVCPWTSLFQTSFYSVVTMTTTGYGNQVPSYVISRLVAICVMLFGSLYLSMPLAIIGNEYDKAWTMVQEEERAKEQRKELPAGDDSKVTPLVPVPSTSSNHGSGSAFPLTKSNSVDKRAPLTRQPSDVSRKLSISVEEKKSKIKSSAVMIIRHSLIDKLHHLHVEYKNYPHYIAPSVTIGLCELRAWLPTFVLGIEEVLRSITLFETRATFQPALTLASPPPTPAMQPSPAGPPQGSRGPRRYSVVGARGAVITKQVFPAAVAQPASSSSSSMSQSSYLPIPQSIPEQQHVPSQTQSFHNNYSSSVLQKSRPSQNAINIQSLPPVMEGLQSERNSMHSAVRKSDQDDDNDDDEELEGDEKDESFESLGSFDLSTESNSGDEKDDTNDTSTVANKIQRAKSVMEQENPFIEQRQKQLIAPSVGSKGGSSHEKKSSDQSSEDDEESDDEEEQRRKVTLTDLHPSITARLQEAESSKSAPQAVRFSVVEGEGANKGSSHRKSMTISEAEYVARRRARTSMYNRLLSMLKRDDPELRRRTMSEEVVERLKKVAEDPTRLRNRLWVLLEFPHSSKEARALQILLIFLICLSIFIMYTQTITSLTLYGENTSICGSLLQAYCSDKDDRFLDPGCFVQSTNGPTSKLLQYNCDESDCFGHGLNFGSGYTNMTCVNATVLPFQSADELMYTYGLPFSFTSRAQMQRISPVCSRIECTDNSVGYYNARPLWIVTEFMMNTIFLVELVLRIAVTQSLTAYLTDVMNYFDILAILPFFLSIIILNEGSINSIDFSILASSPYNFYIVLSRSFLVFRLFKLTRHFRASKVLFETATVVWKQISGMLALLALCVLLFSIVLYELEKGRPCYIGDPGCPVPKDMVGILHKGDLIYISKKGLPSQFPNIFYSVWFSYVTATTTGYGDMVPVSNGGEVMSIFLMVAGTFYMAMPLTAAATTFYNVHEKYAMKGEPTYMTPVNSTVVPSSEAAPTNNQSREPLSNEKKPSIVKSSDTTAATAAIRIFQHGPIGGVGSSGGGGNSDSNSAASSPRPSVGNAAMASLPDPAGQRRQVISETMRLAVHGAIRDFRSFDRLIEELITDLHSSPPLLFDELLMRNEERKFREQFPMHRADSFNHLSTSSSRRSFDSFEEDESPFKRFLRIRRNVAKFCKGLEDAIRQNEQTIVDLLFLHYVMLHGDAD